MGTHVNYYRIIHYLIQLKGELSRITKTKFKDQIRELSNYEIEPHSENDHIPGHKELATKLKYSQAKMNSLLKGLLNELINDFFYSPLIVNEVVHQVHIHLPCDERYKLSK